ARLLHVIDRNAKRQGVHVEALERVVADLGQIASIEEIEDPEVEKERVVGLPGEGSSVAVLEREVRGGLVEIILVVRHGADAEIRGRRDPVPDLDLPRYVVDLAKLARLFEV